jgi:MFS family permease
MSSSFSYNIIAIFNAGSCLGRYIPGVFSDRLGRYNSMIIALALCAATALGLWLPASFLGSSSAVMPLVIVFSLLFGFASGSNISLTPVAVGQLCITQEYGRYYATCYSVVSFGTLTGIPIAGAILQACGGQYWGMIVFTGAAYLASLVFFITARALKLGKIASFEKY